MHRRHAVIFMLVLSTVFTPFRPAAVQGEEKAQHVPIGIGGPKSAEQCAVELIDTDPKSAEQQLLALKSSTAKVLLAYLYMSGKVKIPQAEQKIDELMNAAIADVPDPYGLGEVDKSVKHHYTDMNMFLKHVRFIADAGGLEVELPSSVMEQYPDAAYQAFQQYWGSRRDSYLPIVLADKDNVTKIQTLSTLANTLGEMCGDPTSLCTGTIRFARYRQAAIAWMAASLAPQVFTSNSSHESYQVADRQLDQFLRCWANQELWNQQMYERWCRERKAAEVTMANHYRERFRLTAEKAASYAVAAIAGVCLANLDNYSHSKVNETIHTATYELFSRQNLSLADVQRRLAGKKLSKEELACALRMAILNGANITVIDWLVKQGAPLGGGRESPIFTAVLRPEVIAALLKAGANVNETNCIGKTALFQAAQFNAYETIKLLIAAGAKVNQEMVPANGKEAEEANQTCEFNYGAGSRTPLMYAAAFSDYPAIMYLLSKGANKSAVDSEGVGPLKFLTWNKVLSEADKKRLEQALAL